MTRRGKLILATLCLAAISGCGGQEPGPGGNLSAGAGAQATTAAGSGTQPGAGTSAAGPAGAAGSSVSIPGGSGGASPAPGSTPASGGSTPPAAGGSTTPAVGGGGAAALSGGTAGGGAPAAGSGGDPAPPLPAGTVSMPNIGSVGLGNGGIGVTDLEKATDFFTNLVGMKVQTPMIEREDRFERVLTLGEMPDKPTVTLMQYKDGRTIKDIPSKLVFYVASPAAAVQKVTAGGYETVLSAGFVAQASAIDGYLLEFIQDSSGPMFISIAFAVTDLDKTVKFYTDAFNMKSTGSYDDVSMMGLSEEFIQVMDGGAALVLQHYTLGEHNYKDNPCKTVWHVKDAAAQLAKVMMLGGSMVSPPAPLPAFNNKITAVAKDFDGYLIEIVQD